MLDEDTDDENDEGFRANRKLESLQHQLHALLGQPLLPTGFSSRHLAADPTLARKILDIREEADKAAVRGKNGKAGRITFNTMTAGGSLGAKSVSADTDRVLLWTMCVFAGLG